MKPHRFDALSFIVGTIAILLGLAFLLPAEPTDIFDIVHDFGAWFWPSVLVLIGVAILVPLAARASHSEDDEELDGQDRVDSSDTRGRSAR